MTKEIQARPLPGTVGLVIFLALLFGSFLSILPSTPVEPLGPAHPPRVARLHCGFALAQRLLHRPAEPAEVLILLGSYKGSVREPGWWWTNPIMTKKRISLRVRSLNGEKTKVNDKDGNPVEIAAVIMWRVHDSAQATFDVDTYEQFVAVQSETAGRPPREPVPVRRARRRDRVAARQHGPDRRDAAPGVGGPPRTRRASRSSSRGSRTLRTGQEIAGAMLRRQQAGAIVAAGGRIVDGAVGMVEMALERLAESNTVQLDEERKAAMVSNLLVVSCGEQAASPVINAGTLSS
jgi:hypothetical protein